MRSGVKHSRMRNPPRIPGLLPAGVSPQETDALVTLRRECRPLTLSEDLAPDSIALPGPGLPSMSERTIVETSL